MFSVVVLAGVVLTAACGKDQQGSSAAHLPAARGDSVAPAVAASKAGRRNIVFAGTSLTAGLGLPPDSAYPQLLQPVLDSAGLNYDVINAGVSGETSADLVGRLDWLLQQPFDAIVVETGANDGLRGIDVAEARKNIDAALGRLRQARPGAQLFVVQMEAPPNLGPAYTRAFHSMFGELAAKHGATLLPFLLEGVAGKRELNQGDGIHPNMRGERIVASHLWAALKGSLK
ncbi:MAG: putative acyl-CoA thioesterase [Gemmatimonadetes bacterium]|nr:putative acyl-CoA thioesterase [Gemmatimonadota bacterium]